MRSPMEANLEIVWYAGDEEGETCPTRTFKNKGAQPPAKDIQGRTLFVNTHFGTEAEAWERMIANAEAHVRLEQRDYASARRRLDEKTKALAASADTFILIKDGHLEFLRKQEEAAAQAAEQ